MNLYSMLFLELPQRLEREGLGKTLHQLIPGHRFPPIIFPLHGDAGIDRADK